MLNVWHGEPGQIRRIGRQLRRSMRDYTTKEKVKITVGAISAVVTVGLLAAIALGFLWMPPPP